MLSRSSSEEIPPFDIIASYRRILKDEEISMPIAAILSLVELIEQSRAGTMFELVQDINVGKERLKKAAANAIGLSAGAELFSAFVTSFPHESTDFESLKRELVHEGRKYASESSSRRQKIAHYALKFIKDGAVILTHSYSRVAMQVLLHAHKSKRISVYVTEGRPRGLGGKTVQLLIAAGVPTYLTLDTSVGYLIDKVDMVLVGSEAVLESGGLVNAVGSYQMALIAKASHKPFYAVAESYKFHRFFPLSQSDLNKSAMHLSEDAGNQQGRGPPPNLQGHSVAPGQLPDGSTKLEIGPTSSRHLMRYPEVDYTRPDLISLVFSDVGILTPSGVSQYLVGMLAG